MRVHFFVRSLNRDGAGSHQNAISYIRYLKEHGHTVTVHAINSYNNPPPDIKLIEHSGGKLGLIAGNKLVTELLFAQEKDADIFFLYGVDFIWGAGKYRKRGGSVPVSIYLDTCLSSMDTSQRLSTMYYIKRLIWEKFFGMRDAVWVDGFIASSPFIKDMYIHAGFKADRFYVVPNFFEFDTLGALSKSGTNNIVQLLYAGRITYDKGTDLLINAVKDIPSEILWHLRIVGDGPLREECENLIRKYNLDTRVEIISWTDQDKLREIYGSSDIFIHPSRCPEAFGRTFVEAMSHGIPVIASDIGSAPWTIGDGGVFFTKNDTAGLRGAIIGLINNEAIHKQLGERGIEQAKKFKKEAVGPHLEDTLREVVAL